MTQERTEEAGESGLLTITVGGSPVRLQALTYEASDEWLEKVGSALGRLDLPDRDEDADGMLRKLMTATGDLALQLVLEYDVHHVLGDRDAVTKLITKREVKAALDLMVTVEDPFGEDAARSLAEAFGLPVRILRMALEAGLEAAAVDTPPQASSPSSVSTSGDSISVEISDPSGPASSSSSAGRTRRSASRTMTAIAAG